MKRPFRLLSALFAGIVSACLSVCAESALVFQTDFGLKDGAVSAMKGVAFGVSPALKQFDLTHEIPAYNVWEAAFRLKQTTPYWPGTTVFVSVVDPGVGTARKAVVARTKSGQLIVTPDNGTLTFLAESPGLAEVREIDVARQRLKGSEASHTFHGRDVFAYVGARLAAGQLDFADVGPRLTNDVIRIAYQRANATNGVIVGGIPVLDVQYGNVWSNIPRELFAQGQPRLGEVFAVKILHAGKTVLELRAPYSTSFGDVPKGQPLLYLNSLLDVSLALNQGSFAQKFHIGSGPDWSLELRKVSAAGK
ncbi:MAG TPA: S-adenosyl-l-methionine hydroxide adenosyltransferase family protein [Candidatus Limnocylindria bacterium]|nr:S-adenosyl-l-methionine hydroxide adenosyltransferase family protein [Candidatus Limnocylindria bacterium]